MEMTMATIGRMTKNLDTVYAPDYRKGPRRPPPSLPQDRVAPAKPAFERVVIAREFTSLGRAFGVAINIVYAPPDGAAGAAVDAGAGARREAHRCVRANVAGT